ncbi:hypothetical protein LOAG_07185 [Loa loa]|uniref:Apple domain-containing protein n=1 Tax=Loa loa TaxID=7209 RepID=A0A1I7VWU8_LOALO|nr:hypothetical protein LOAG_07185 [Loa loa]EFO21303.1 hypothetical protein LOAG_07185 [Loa loa]
MCYCSSIGNENEIDFDRRKVVTLGPARGGLQRAVFDEVLVNDINELTEEITQVKNDIDAYDDKLVDLRGEDPLFIPKPYRDEKEVTNSSAAIVERERASFTTFPRIIPVDPIGRTSAPIQRLSLPSEPPVRPPIQPLPWKEFPLQSTSLLPKTVAQRPLPTRTSFKPEKNPQTVLLMSRLPQLTNQPQVNFKQLRTSFVPPTSITILPHPTESTPITPHVQPSQPSSRIGFLSTSHSTSSSLRTGVCHASIFYISTPMQSPKRHFFTHFAITVSTDQCARTCHEFNCAVAHYDPLTGRCQFNPSTAFAIRKGQCPPWPATHYKNNVQTSIPLRVFCVQCHRGFRRGRVRSQGHFRTGVLRVLYSGRLPSSLQRSGLARMHSILSKQQVPFRNITSELEIQQEHIDSEKKPIDDIDYHWNTNEIEVETKNATSNGI